MTVGDWISVAAAVISVGALILNVAAASKEAFVQTEGLRARLNTDMLSWAHEAIDAVSEGIGLAKSRGLRSVPEFRLDQISAAQKLSSLADRGRMFFPNYATRQRTPDKDAAFQGYRPPVLDALVFACYRVERIDSQPTTPDEAGAGYLSRCRRLLVSEIQQAIDPRRRSRTLLRLSLGGSSDGSSSIRSAAELGELLEAEFPGTLVQRRDAAWIAERVALNKRQRR